MSERKRILLASSEAAPYAKSGGLADVVGSLPEELTRKGYEVRVVIPLYQKVIDRSIQEMKKITTFDVDMGQKKTIASVWELDKGDVVYYFIEHQGYFERPNFYGYPDDGERFAFFDISVVDMLDHIGWFPQLIHSNDWQAGMIPLLAKYRHPYDDRYQSIKHVYTIHNILFQGNFPPAMLESCLDLPMDYFYDGTLRQGRDMNFMKGGILFADKITTVSNNYAHEILTPQYGEGLEAVLGSRSWDLWGIVNGIDTKVWNPETDERIEKRYSAKDPSGKGADKAKLQEQMGLRVSDDTFLMAMVSRLTSQKGIYLLLDHIYEVMGMDVQLVVLGTGDMDAENRLKGLEYQFPHRAVYYCGYNEELSHQIYAGADAFLMPSLFEPCGISQLISMRYGTLPIVRETGGLKDTVEPYNQFENTGTGFTFANASREDLLQAVRRASDTYYYNKDAWKLLMEHAMQKDVSWENSAKLYDELYSSLVGD